VQLAVGEVLRVSRAKIGNSRIEIAADFGAAAAIFVVAERAAREETSRASARISGSGLYGFVSWRAWLGIERLRTARATTFSIAVGSSAALKPR
jgi:hypothetical protein